MPGIDPAEIRTAAELRKHLRELWQHTGRTVREVSDDAWLIAEPGLGTQPGHSTVGDWVSGTSLPGPQSAALFAALLEVLGVTDTDEWLAAWRRVRLKAGPRRTAREPYRGLEAFEAAHAELFFGRETLTRQILDRIRELWENGGGILIVVGPSGSGKSSLLRAGVIPALAGEPVTISVRTPVDKPEPSTAGEPGRRLVVIDQFEEIFTNAFTEDQQDRYLAGVHDLANPPGGAVVVLGLRADFYDQLLGHRGMVDAIRDGQITVGPLDADELRQVIRRPAERVGVKPEDGLVELIVREAIGGPGVLPMLSHALLSTWKIAGGELTVAAYRETRGIHGAVANTADTVYLGLDAHQQELARRLFLSLVHLHPDSPDTRRRLSRDSLSAEVGDPVIVDDIVREFVDARLLTAGERYIEVSHEALITGWPQLRDWLDADRNSLLIRAQVIAAAKAWDRDGRHPEDLYQGTRLAAAQSWASGPRADPTAQVSDFLAAGERHARRRTTVLRRTVATLSVLSLTLLLSTGYALDRRGEVERQRALGDEQRRDAVSRLLAGRADTLRETDAPLAMQLSLAAYRLTPTPEARASLLQAYAGPAATRLGGFAGEVQAVAVAPGESVIAAGSAGGTVRLWRDGGPGGPLTTLGEALTGPSGTVYTVAFSPDGRTLVAAGSEGALHRWDITDTTRAVPLPPLTGPSATVYSVAYSPDGRTIAAGSADGRIWRWSGGTALPSLETGETTRLPVTSIAFSPDGRVLAAGQGAEVRLWPAAGGAPVTLAGHEGDVTAVAFSPDSRTIASGSRDQTVRLWNITDPARPAARLAPLAGPSSWINAVAFSKDGTIVAAAASDRTISSWEAGTGAPAATLTGPAQLTSIAFGAGDSVVAGSGDATVRVWRAGEPSLGGAGGTIFNVAAGVSRGTNTPIVAAAASKDRATRLADITDPRRPAPIGPVLTSTDDDVPYAGTTALSPDGRLLAIGTRTGPVHLWDVSDPARPRRAGVPLTGLADLVETVAFSPGGDHVVAGGQDRTVKIWDTRGDGRAIASIGLGSAIVYSVAISPDGRSLAIGTTANTVRLVDLSDPARPRQRGADLGGFGGYVYSVAFSADSRYLAAGSADRSVRLWDVTGSEIVRDAGMLTGAGANVYWVAFAPDGHTLAAASADRTILVWDDVTERTPSMILRGLSEPARTVAFAADGHTLVSAGQDARIRLWELDPGRVSAWVCATAGEPVTRQEWEQYVPGDPYTAPC
ncbi:hypothetical protein ACQP2E_10820 [Actinoplanes sp. CA-015351]|uniref:nSTAND1 domain-containing NTPase n=1 Tax=Actinoplanes sp. CA-015351 TaxID=3239897 RepID=UPI003D952692